MTVAGLGIDTVEVERFAVIMKRRPSILEKIFTVKERDYADSFNNPAQAYAVRFAAKEAAMKALGVGIGAFPFNEVEVVRQDSGAPTLALHGKAAERALFRGVKSWHVSLTHTCSTATAMVIAE